MEGWRSWVLSIEYENKLPCPSSAKANRRDSKGLGPPLELLLYHAKFCIIATSNVKILFCLIPIAYLRETWSWIPKAPQGICITTGNVFWCLTFTVWQWVRKFTCNVHHRDTRNSGNRVYLYILQSAGYKRKNYIYLSVSLHNSGQSFDTRALSSRRRTRLDRGTAGVLKHRDNGRRVSGIRCSWR